ncbi:BTB/POZ domain-containing protein 6-like [Malaya genurostris]|uniref:BTB/POZ domain-containing protein 6-like n=1 Tax=Malaya genurostris TaxID=325434 RepID=UPI0026F403DD|nr:BTB/POZ domain-containing protein 6-like [Malaya genurostris]
MNPIASPVNLADSHSWRQCSNRDIKSRMVQLHDTGARSDCEFWVGSDYDEIVGHKLVLSLASPVFESMWYGSVDQPKDEPICVPDTRAHVFKMLIKYIYTDAVDIESIDDTIDLYYEAEKYLLPGLADQCTDYLERNLEADNVCKIFEFAVKNQLPNLKDMCINTIRCQTKYVITSEGFLAADLSTIIFILDQDWLNIDSEMDLFKAIKLYALENNLSRKERLQPKKGDKEVDSNNNEIENPTILHALHRIRFLNMEPSELAPELIKTNILLDSEALTILVCVEMKSCEHNLEMPEGFSDVSTSRVFESESILMFLKSFNLH